MEYFTQQLINGLTLGSIYGLVYGIIGFDMEGDVTAPGYVFYEWKNGTYDYVK
jgi:branched-chain amino acid transport system substrate-binding protein